MSVYWKPSWSRCPHPTLLHLSSFQHFTVRTRTIFGIKMILFVTAKNSDRSSLFNIIFNPQSPSLFTRIFGLSPSKDVAFAEFFTTYAISIISAALGLAKCLKNGVARPIAPGGALDGLLTGKFVVALLASAGSLVAKGLCIAFTFMGGPVSHILHIIIIIS